MTTAETSENGQEAASGRQAKIVALVVAVSFFMQILDGTIVTTSLPQMAASFNVQPVSMSIGITVYMLTMAAFIPLSGWLGDRFGARRIFLMSIAVFTGASLFCGLSGSLAEFVLWRAVQGAGSALMTPVGRIIVLKNARKSELVQAIALITWPALTAPVLGPVLGGFITTYASWHWNFLINIPIGILGMALVLRFVPEQRETNPGRLDFLGFILSAAGLTFLLAALELSVKWDGGLCPSYQCWRRASCCRSWRRGISSPSTIRCSIFRLSASRPSRCRHCRRARPAGWRSMRRRSYCLCCSSSASA